jgi:hypothetical protein
MNTRSRALLQVLAFLDFNIVGMVGAGLLWRWAGRHIPLWVQLLLLAFLVVMHRRYKRRLSAMARFERLVAGSLSPAERRARYHWICAQFVIAALLLAWAIPFAFSSAAFWCIYATVVIMLVALLISAREELFPVA